MIQNKIIFSDNGNLYLDTSLTQSAFAKSRFALKMEENGFLATRNGSGWSFSSWRFTGTQSSTTFNQEPQDEEEMSPAVRALKHNETVLLEGTAFEGHTLKDFMDMQQTEPTDRNTSALAMASASTVSAIEDSIRQDINLEAIGGGGIFISDDFTKIIFMPHEVFNTCVSCFGDKTYSAQSGIFIQPTLEDRASLHFLESVIAYRTLTQKFPFPELNTTRRHEDCLDHNFIPLKDSIWGLNEELSFFVDNALCRNPKITQRKKKGNISYGSFSEKLSNQIKDVSDSSEPQQTKETVLDKSDFILHFPLEIFCRQLGLTENISLPSSGRLEPSEHNSKISQEAFEENTRRSQQRFQKNLSVKRWFRRRRTVLTSVAAGVIICAILVGSWFSNQKNRPTSLSLTAFETAQMFMSSINRMDIASCQGCGKGADVNTLINSLSSYYVASHTRSAYSGKDSTVSPAEWFIHNMETNFSIWGIAQLEIDGIKADPFFEGPKKLIHPKPISSEDGKQLQKGEKKVLQVSYKLIYNDDPEFLECIIHNDTLTLEWSGKKWTVVQFQQSYEQERSSFTQFKADYTQALSDARKILDQRNEDKSSTSYNGNSEDTSMDQNQNMMTPVGFRNSQLVPEAEEAAILLEEKFNFIPTVSEIASAREYVAKTYTVDLR